jgi:hypothetical protein
MVMELAVGLAVELVLVVLVELVELVVFLGKMDLARCIGK